MLHSRILKNKISCIHKRALKTVYSHDKSSANKFLEKGAFKCQFHKMVKHTQTIRRQFADELFECAWPFCETGL